MSLSPYLAHMRPRTFAPTFAMTLTGYAISPARPHGAGSIAVDLALLFLVHSVLLWGGTNAFNSAQDRDGGPLNLLPNPPALPPHLGAFGLACKGAALALAALRGITPVLLVALACALSILYSWKSPLWRRAKEIGGADNLIYAGGCGLGSIALGYSFTGAPFTTEAVLVGVAFSVAIFGGCPTSQIFQLRPGQTYADARNYAALLGPARTLRVGALFFAAHVALLALVALPAADVLVAQPLRIVLWAAWALLVAAAAVHSLAWSRAPFRDPYRRMLRQFGLMMTSQIVWTIEAWIATAD